MSRYIDADALIKDVTTSKTININNQPKPIIQEVVQVSDDSINKIADAVVRKQTERSE